MVAVTVIYFEVHSTIVLSILILIKEGIITWTSEFQCYGQVCWRIGDEESKRHMKVLFQVYVDLLKAFDLFKRTHHSIVSRINIDRILTFVTNSIDILKIDVLKMFLSLQIFILIVEIFTSILLFVQTLIEIIVNMSEEDLVSLKTYNLFLIQIT